MPGLGDTQVVVLQNMKNITDELPVTTTTEIEKVVWFFGKKQLYVALLL